MSLPTRAYRLIGRFSVTRFDRWLHPILYRATGGRGIFGRILGCEMVLLTTVGRRSGRPRTVALFAFPVPEPAGTWAVIASRGGSRTLPAWYHNLVAQPEVTVRARETTTPALARDAAGEEYEAIFERAATAYPGFRLYRAEAGYHIPIVVLEPRSARSSPAPVGVPAEAPGPGSR